MQASGSNSICSCVRIDTPEQLEKRACLPTFKLVSSSLNDFVSVQVSVPTLENLRHVAIANSQKSAATRGGCTACQTPSITPTDRRREALSGQGAFVNLAHGFA
eukprot:CAMPEP_0177591968 /NCGR_PEP_ID=MMETSP0419_2-20121207/8296_1 /TAXON_ID=582737 /ORGANISM="Tetraselmis sp., Strain GSL018" /LENGTH=103 /DNA_ID=CAMNT_0019082777 /DNA_START=1022 /DNA_END=1336 /DNA_ORIENTATION=-